MKDHEIAALVNKVRDIAVEFHGAQQLRDRIANVLVPVLTPSAPAVDAGAREAMRNATREMILANPEGARLEMVEMARETRELRAALSARASEAAAEPVAYCLSDDVERLRSGGQRWAKVFTGADGIPDQMTALYTAPPAASGQKLSKAQITAVFNRTIPFTYQAFARNLFEEWAAK
ncbi:MULTISPECIES: hypothetical protein [Paraburkholderia]|jgi:hypothetical protein|uniref:Uncharacterized protein n=1 Tax=Paraburkholderia hospita TaxID=169430 RepID=A0AAN1MIQ7_9BURK|nr:hypothetical protein [Paraburkholderia hospita]AUT68561.1 hypothetical protein C2L64_09660 [Paraburkholderia hospita]SEI28000.1 hypothetical protein SAMN05192544_11049 [Paraburkholderia hospita]